MLIRMTTSIAGAGFDLHPGDERDFPRDDALRLIAAEYAVPVAEQHIERAVNFEPAVEARKRGRPRRN
jgi:hypothetical protein